MQARFMVTVEFMDWKIPPEPMRVVSFVSIMVCMLLYTGSALLSLPYSKPTSWESR